MRNKRRNSSWQNVSNWYSKKVGNSGHYYQESLVFPKLKEILGDITGAKVLDLGCGEGVLSRELSGFKKYLGIDLSNNLIELAKDKNVKENVEFIKGDVSKRLEIDSLFTHAFLVLSLQNIENYLGVFKNANKYLENNGQLYIILNHPHIRIPKSTSWGTNLKTFRQYREVYRYLSAHKIRIDMHPGLAKAKDFTYSFHRSLNDITLGLSESGFLIEYVLEWSSNKQSEGKFAKMENFAREEIPMFMCIKAIKKEI